MPKRLVSKKSISRKTLKSKSKSKSKSKDEQGNETTKDVKYVLDGYIWYNGSGKHGHYMFIECDKNGEDKYIFNDSNVSNFTKKSQVDTNGYIFSYKKISL